MSISKKLRQLNLRGIDKATAIAVAQHIETLEKELSLYKSLEARGEIIRLKFPVDSFYWSPKRYCDGIFSDKVLLDDTVCDSCQHKDCKNHLEIRPIRGQVSSLEVAAILQEKKDVFKTETECKKFCKEEMRNMKGKDKQNQARREESQMSNYVSRSELSEEHVEKLRSADRQYYEDHKEEVNQKDRNKYHALHPNARYYKPRKKKGDNGQLPGQMSMEDIGISISTEEV